MSSDRVALRINDIITNCERAIDYVGEQSHQAFAADQRSVDAVERCIERLCEAAIKLGEERMSQVAPEIGLSALRQLGNILRHEYDRVDPRLIHAMMVDRLPTLAARCRQVLDDEGLNRSID